MKRNSKEFYDLIEQFERDLKFTTYRGEIKRDNTGPNNVFYTDGILNYMFQAYMLGYSYAKFVFNKGE